MLDLIIIGSSAAGASAGIYAARRNLDFKIVALDTGGEVALSGEVDNFPGWGTTDGIFIAGKFVDHLKMYDVEPETGVEVTAIEKHADGHFIVRASQSGDESCFESRSVIVTTGVHPRLLNVPGEREFKGKGVTYCTTCDGPLFKDKVVATVGAGNAGLESVLMMNDLASKVYLLNKYADFRKGEPILVQKARRAPNVEILYEAMTTGIIGNDFVEGLKYRHNNGDEQSLQVEGIFVHIGMVPNSDFLPESVEKDQFGQVKVNNLCATNVPGLFAAGDVTDVPYKQIAIASGQGVCAALSAVDYLNRLA